MAEPHYDGLVYEIGDGGDPPKPMRRHFYFRQLSRGAGTGSIVCHVYYGDTNNKSQLESTGAHTVNPTTGYLMPEGETATYAFMRFTFRNWTNREVDNLSFIADPV